MKKTLIATVAVASIIFTGISCKWFAPKANDKQPINIVGKWQVDTLINNGKSQEIAAILPALLDSNYVLKFNADSTFSALSVKDSTHDYYYLQADMLYLKQDTSFMPYRLTKTNDSLIAITSKDSLTIVLKRQ